MTPVRDVYGVASEPTRYISSKLEDKVVERKSLKSAVEAWCIQGYNTSIADLRCHSNPL